MVTGLRERLLRFRRQLAIRTDRHGRRLVHFRVHRRRFEPGRPSRTTRRRNQRAARFWSCTDACVLTSAIDSSVLYTWTGASSETSKIGYPDTGAGDLNSEGVGDLLFGTYYGDWRVFDSGAVFVYSRTDGFLFEPCNDDFTLDRIVAKSNRATYGPQKSIAFLTEWPSRTHSQIHS